MMFRVWGHENIRGTHKNTFEFTKDEFVTVDGDCIVGIRADFDLNKLREFVKNNSHVRIVLKCGGLEEVIVAKTNPDFDDEVEFVVRLGEYASKRTFAVRADKAAKHFNRELIRALQMGSPMEVRIEKAVE